MSDSHNEEPGDTTDTGTVPADGADHLYSNPVNEKGPVGPTTEAKMDLRGRIPLAQPRMEGGEGKELGKHDCSRFIEG